MMEQTYFVTASYGVSALVIGGLALWIMMSARYARAKVDHLEKSNE